jgi:hypothetical protein
LKISSADISLLPVAARDELGVPGFGFWAKIATDPTVTSRMKTAVECSGMRVASRLFLSLIGEVFSHLV